MMGIITTLTTLIYFSVCGIQQANQQTIQATIKNNHSIIENSIGDKQTLVDTIKEKDISKWTNLDFLNEGTFVVEDSVIGSGIITLSDAVDVYEKKLSIYNATGKVIATVEQKENEVISTYKGKIYYNRDDTINPFSPRLYTTNPEYFLLAFDCVSSDHTYYTVVINRQTGETGKIKKSDKFFKYQTIEEFIDNWTAIAFDFDRSSNPLRKSPNDDSEIINNEKQTKYRIWSGEKISLTGDWLQINIEDIEEKGWIRWRQGNQILIKINYAC